MTESASTPVASSSRWVGDIWIFAAIVIAFLGISRWQYSGHERFVTVNRGEVVYSITSSKAIALKLAGALKDVGEFNGVHKTVRLDYTEGRHHLYLIVLKDFVDAQPAQIAQLRRGIQPLCADVFGTEPVTVWLTDVYVKPHTELIQLPVVAK